MGLVLQGILNAPYPDDPAEMGAIEWAQVKSAMREASAEIERLRVMAYQPPSRHPEGCNCGRCVPF